MSAVDPTCPAETIAQRVKQRQRKPPVSVMVISLDTKDTTAT
jgi:hypothetical protein